MPSSIRRGCPSITVADKRGEHQPMAVQTHLAIALGRAAIDAGYRVKFVRADVLVEQLYCGLADNTVSKVIDAILRAEVVVIDELGFTPLDLVGANHLFRLVSVDWCR
jgi:DNA replication protein DnaC